MYENVLELIKWWASHLLFVVILNLAIFGAYHAYQWYKVESYMRIDVSEWENERLAQFQSEIAKELKFRGGKQG